ncbi:Tripartite-type tricarboxylate transporter, receptor component TctC [Terribacillus halophilus]|uniref:Tripartite-type tricarboxylate transporter, receptor component TctC n=1 Tax=Terribacillus halophilus TaxID=361279 RepID=A0A1G6IRP1_9BACI|nr:tripartite tricarboxylate transporter substrate binding protein [Terribacillus halophilus]SDC09111.1 Tripartite-type tricarboxylate transporter, receptor component TctC [Terribacillus halophilus]
MKKFGMIAILLLLLIMTACSSGASSGDEYPSKNLEIVAPASPGGGWDLTARSVENVLSGQKLVEENINVVNKPGGGGEVGWKYLESKDSHSLAINSSLVLTNNLLGQSEMTYEGFTPIATLATEWQSLAVPPDSEYESAKELLEAIKEDPASIKIGVGPGLGNDDHLSLVQAASEFGIDPSQMNFLVYEGGGDVVTALLGGHVDAVTTSLSEVKDQYLADKLNILAVSSDKPVEGIEDVPTWTDQGIDLVFPHWRGIMGPPDMTEEEIAYWDEKLSEMVETEEWQKVLENNDWEGFYKNSEETKAFMDEQHNLYKSLIEDSGLVK